MSGKEMRKNFIRLVPGDKVEVELTPYDSRKGANQFPPEIISTVFDGEIDIKRYEWFFRNS